MYVNEVNKILKPPFNIMHSNTAPPPPSIVNITVGFMAELLYWITLDCTGV